MNSYGEKGKYVYDPLSFASLLIEKNFVADDWNKTNKLHKFLDGCETALEKSKDIDPSSGLKLIHKKQVIDIALSTGFMDGEKMVKRVKEHMDKKNSVNS